MHKNIRQNYNLTSMKILQEKCAKRFVFVLNAIYTKQLKLYETYISQVTKNIRTYLKHYFRYVLNKFSVKNPFNSYQISISTTNILFFISNFISPL